jgi:hypothetical protein
VSKATEQYLEERIAALQKQLEQLRTVKRFKHNEYYPLCSVIQIMNSDLGVIQSYTKCNEDEWISVGRVYYNFDGMVQNSVHDHNMYSIRYSIGWEVL